MDYPSQAPRIYVNPGGNVIASGLYRSHVTQDLANDFPEWMHLRQNPRSVGQQFLSSMAINMERIEQDLEYNVKSKFLLTAPVDDVDVLYRVKIPSNIDLTNASASGIRCIASPSGMSPSGVSQIWVEQVGRLEDFYYNVLPTRIEIQSSGSFVGTINGESWSPVPSGIVDLEQKYIDVWKNRHNLTWCYTDDKPTGHVRKQDSQTMEDFEVYDRPGSGSISGMDYYDGMLWCLNNDGSNYSLTLASTKTQVPQATTLDTLSTYDMSSFSSYPSGIIVDPDGNPWVCDSNRTSVFKLVPRYDYFIIDKSNRYIYFREDYRNSGVFISNT